MTATRELINRACRISCLAQAVRNAVEEVASVDVHMTMRDDMLCMKVTNIRTPGRYAAVKNVLDTNFCESLTFVKATKTTLTYALPVRREVQA